MSNENTIEVKYVCYVTTSFPAQISELHADVYPPTVTLANGETHEINVSSKLGEEFVTDIRILPDSFVHSNKVHTQQESTDADA